MHNRKTRTLLITACITYVAALALLIGCGGGGGGTGRQTLPGENPAGPGITTGTGTGTPPGTGTGTTPLPGPKVEEKIKNGWAAMDAGNWGGAILHFDDAISDSRATVAERQQAYNGRGWAKVKYYDTLSGISDFIQAGELLESKLGYALALIQQSTQGGIARAVTIMEEIGLNNTAYQLTIEHKAIGVSTAEARAMLAYAYFWRAQAGDADKARTLIIAARNEDGSSSSSVAQIYNTLKTAGLSGI